MHAMPSSATPPLGTGFSAAALFQNASGLLAQHVTVARPAFASVFDPLAGGIQAVPYLDFKLLALGADNPQQALERAFHHAETAGFLESLLQGLVALGGLDLDACLRALHPSQKAGSPVPEPAAASDASLASRTAQPPAGRVLTLESWSQDMPDWIRMADLSAGLLLARSRLCMVQVIGEHGNSGKGTGFLIGPQTVLTNFHVLHTLIDPQTGRALPDSARRIVCDFDQGLGTGQERCQAVEDWLIAYSPMRPQALSENDPYRQTPHAWGTAPLDFCALRLLNAPGRRRGWYDLRDTGSIHHERDVTFVVQHPSGAEQHVGIGTRSRAFAADSPYMEHQAPTAPGSSGGLCLDHTLKPLALHYGAERDTAGALLHNSATFLHHILRVAPDIGTADPAHDLLWRLDPLDGRLVIGRRRTQEHVLRMMQNKADKPILVIRGERGSGKSFSSQIIRACMPRDRVALVLLSAHTLPTSAHQLAIEILTQAGIPSSAIETLPASRPSDMSVAAWLAEQLLPRLQSVLIAHLQPMQRQLWLVLDDLEHIDIPQTDARELLDALYAAAFRIPCLRIVLMGLRQQPIGLDPGHVQLETLPGPNDVRLQELVDSLCGLFTEHRLGVPMEEVTRHARLALSLTRTLLAHAEWGEDGQASVRPTLLGRLSQLLQTVHAREVSEWQN